MKSFWGIDLGGTKIEGVVLGAADPKAVLFRDRIPTEKEKGYEHIVAQIGKLVEMMKSTTGLSTDAIGIGTPGAIDPTTQLLKNSNTTVLNGMPFKADLEKALGLRVEIANDANCFALAEAKMGAVPEVLPDAAVVFGVIMGTGVGGGIVVNGKVINGRHGIGGEWGHNMLDPEGPECYCGRNGCVERMISGPFNEAYYAQISGEKRSLKDIVARHETGKDPHATATIERLIRYFGKAMGPIINTLDPDAIVLGGGVSNVPYLYTDGVAEVAKYLFNDKLETTFLQPKLGDSAGVFGAAMLVS